MYYIQTRQTKTINFNQSQLFLSILCFRNRPQIEHVLIGVENRSCFALTPQKVGSDFRLRLECVLFRGQFSEASDRQQQLWFSNSRFRQSVQTLFFARDTDWPQCGVIYTYDNADDKSITYFLLIFYFSVNVRRSDASADLVTTHTISTTDRQTDSSSRGYSGSFSVN